MLNKLTYDFLKDNVVEIEVLEDINMGDVIDYEDQLHVNDKSIYVINEEEELIIPKGTIAKLMVQPYNYHYEIEFENHDATDICFDTDEELRELVRGLKIIGPNTHFVKEA